MDARAMTEAVVMLYYYQPTNTLGDSKAQRKGGRCQYLVAFCIQNRFRFVYKLSSTEIVALWSL